MIIVVEGVDGAGKTTLVKELENRLNVPVYKNLRSPLRGTPVLASQTEDSACLDTAIAMGGDIIFDRFFPSEYAYGKALDRKTLDVDEIFYLDRQLAKVPHVCVLLKNNPDRPRLLDREVHPEVIGAIQDEYVAFTKESVCNWLIFEHDFEVGDKIEAVMLMVRSQRLSKEQIYMRLANEVSRRSTCLSRRVGAVLVSTEGHVVSTGYNGSPAGCDHQAKCPRLHKGVKSGSELDLCEDVHAEENCLAQAAKRGVSADGGIMFCMWSPCHRCLRMCINAGLKEIVYENQYGDVRALQQRYPIKLRRIDEGI